MLSGQDVHLTCLANVRLPGTESDTRYDVDVASGRVQAIVPAGSGKRSDPALVLDAEGGYLIPGLWDYHVHFAQWANTLTRLDLSAAGSAEECAHRLGEYAATHPPAPGGAVLAMGYRGALWDPEPNVALLDRYTGATPVIAISGDFHSAWFNSAALALLGLPEHDGPVRENTWFDVIAEVDALPASDPDAGLRLASQDAARRGVVGVVDVDFNRNYALWPERVARGLTQLRVRAGFYPEALDDVIARSLTDGAVLDPSALTVLGPLKIIADGSLNTKTAYCFDAYPGGGHGTLNVPMEDLVSLLTRAREAGLTVAVHAIGDRANSIVLDAFDQTGAHGSIEHAQLLAAGDATRMAQLGVCASIQPAHLLDDRAPAAHLWPGRTPYAFATLRDAGVALHLGSDAPVAPLDPWLAIAAAVGRGEPEEEAWEPTEVLDARTALAASTAQGRTHVRAGDVADLVVTHTDPLAVGLGAQELRQMRVLATVLGGRVTHDARR
ncbi:MAG: amidohydrolase family protein [Bowdeniella nasicola]|nr:amidohydrolase family protein [Bowdeniella nasicola]